MAVAIDIEYSHKNINIIFQIVKALSQLFFTNYDVSENIIIIL